MTEKQKAENDRRLKRNAYIAGVCFAPFIGALLVLWWIVKMWEE